MSLHPTNLPAPLPSRSRLARLRAFAVVAGVGFVGYFAVAGPDSPRPGEPDVVAEQRTEPPAAGPARVPEAVSARTVLAALDADTELRGVNLVVSVVDRVAVIGGPVANARQARRAEEIIRAVPGIVDVRNTCFVANGPDPLLRSVADRLGSTLPPRPVLFELPGVLTGTLPPTPVGVPGGGFAMADPPGTVVARKPPGEPGVLGAPVAPAAAGMGPVPSTTPGILTGSRGDILAAAEAVRKTEARFARLTVEVRDDSLVIGGAAPLAADAWDFAKKLQSVPGVARVAVGMVTGNE